MNISVSRVHNCSLKKLVYDGHVFFFQNLLTFVRSGRPSSTAAAFVRRCIVVQNKIRNLYSKSSRHLSNQITRSCHNHDSPAVSFQIRNLKTYPIDPCSNETRAPRDIIFSGSQLCLTPAIALSVSSQYKYPQGNTPRRPLPDPKNTPPCSLLSTSYIGQS
jgi:hypothetical protein